jgi:site-specific DNA-methyltransferase (adenine-specific)
MLELNKIYCGRAEQLIKELPDDCIDMVVTSPPYNVNLSTKKDKNGINIYVKRSKNGNRQKYKEGGYNDQLMIEDYFDVQKQVINELLRVCNGYVFYNIQILSGNKKAIFRIIGEFSDNLKEVFIWDKCGAEPSLNPRTANSGFELILVFCKDKNEAIPRQFTNAYFERGTFSNVIRVSKNSSNKFSKEHKATFPEKLAHIIIDNFSTKGSLILDPFMGSGTTAKVAKDLGRYFIGFELSQEYVDMANRRITDLFFQAK